MAALLAAAPRRFHWWRHHDSPEAGKYQLTVTDGVATVNGITSDVLNVKPGDTVTLTADTTKFPENEEFGWWEITPMGLFPTP